MGEAGIEVVDVPYPKLKSGYVIVKVKAAGICGSDLHSYLQTTARFPGEPIGHEGAGEVAEVGAGVEDFVVGDRVTYNPHAPRTNQFCGKCIFCLTGRPLGCPERPNMRLTDGGCMAEYQSIKATALFKLPRNVSYDVGSVVEPFGVSYHGVLETSSLKEDQTIVILGPGAIGLAAVIAAKLVSPKQIIVTGTTADEAVQFKLAKKLGANVLINVQKEDSVKRVMKLTDGVGADVVLEAVGGHHPQLQQGLNMLRYEGECVVIGHPERGGQAVASLDGDTYNGVILKRQKILGSWVFDTVTYVKILDLLEKKMVDLETLITHRLPLTDAVKGFELGFKQECVKATLLP